MEKKGGGSSIKRENKLVKKTVDSHHRITLHTIVLQNCVTEHERTRNETRNERNQKKNCVAEHGEGTRKRRDEKRERDETRKRRDEKRERDEK
jgi:hypothetical protein